MNYLDFIFNLFDLIHLEEGGGSGSRHRREKGRTTKEKSGVAWDISLSFFLPQHTLLE